MMHFFPYADALHQIELPLLSITVSQYSSSPLLLEGTIQVATLYLMLASDTKSDQYLEILPIILKSDQKLLEYDQLFCNLNIN